MELGFEDRLGLTGTPLSWHHRSIPLSPMGDSLSVMAITLVSDKKGASAQPRTRADLAEALLRFQHSMSGPIGGQNM
jgi:hypothetical protein